MGKITAVSGKSEVKKSGGTKKFNAFKGMAITQGDTIITGTDGKISLDLDANKEVTIGASTTLTISQLVESAKALGGKTSLKLQNGQVLIKVKKKLEGDSRFEIETPTAIMGVMGTEFFVSVNSQDNVVLNGGVGINGDYLGVLEGTVHVVSPTNPTLIERMITSSQQLIMENEQWTQEQLSLNALPQFALEQHLKYLNEEKYTLELESAVPARRPSGLRSPGPGRDVEPSEASTALGRPSGGVSTNRRLQCQGQPANERVDQRLTTSAAVVDQVNR